MTLMEPIRFDNPTAAMPARALRRHQEWRFDDVIAAADFAVDRRPDNVEQVVRQGVEQLVASAFVQPMLAAMRDDPMRSDLFHGGLAEDMFGSQLDARMAQRITRAANLPVVDLIYERFMQNVNAGRTAPNHDHDKPAIDFRA